MNDVTLARAALDGCVAEVDSLDQLDAIHAPGCAAVILRQAHQPNLSNWITTLPADRLPRMREVVHTTEVMAALQSMFQRCGTPDCAERDELARSISALSGAFAAVMRAHWLLLRLDVVTGNACRRFHVDAITARLVCTYRGTGTQYGIAEGDKYPTQILTVPDAHPILLRGSLWRESPPSWLKHRSPPIVGTGETRLLLVLDPVFDPEDED